MSPAKAGNTGLFRVTKCGGPDSLQPFADVMQRRVWLRAVADSPWLRHELYTGICDMSHAATFLAEAIEIAKKVDTEQVEALCNGLAELRERNGRLFILGVGGSAGNCSHAVNDFRKLCGIEA